MRVVAFANHKGGAGETATAINLPAALVKAGRCIFFIDLDPQAGATQGLGFQDSRTAFSILQGGSALTALVLPLVIPFRKFANRALRVHNFIPGTVNGRLNLTRAMPAVLPQRLPFIRNSVQFSEAPGTGKTPSRHDPRHPTCSDYRVLAADGGTRLRSAGSNAPPQICEPRPPTPRTVVRDA